MQERYLAIWSDENGNSRCTMFQTQNAGDFPFGVEAKITPHLDGYNDGAPLILVEMPGASGFRPAVVNVQDDDEVPMSFVDL